MGPGRFSWCIYAVHLVFIVFFLEIVILSTLLLNQLGKRCTDAIGNSHRMDVWPHIRVVLSSILCPSATGGHAVLVTNYRGHPGGGNRHTPEQSSSFPCLRTHVCKQTISDSRYPLWNNYLSKLCWKITHSSLYHWDLRSPGYTFKF